jgi:hypothetical protein
MRSRDGAEGEDKRDQGCARRNRVGQQSESYVAHRQTLRHDPRADNGGEQKKCASELRHNPARE